MSNFELFRALKISNKHFHSFKKSSFNPAENDESYIFSSFFSAFSKFSDRLFCGECICFPSPFRLMSDGLKIFFFSQKNKKNKSMKSYTSSMRIVPFALTISMLGGLTKFRKGVIRPEMNKKIYE